MKRFLARVFSMHPLALTAALCLIPATAAGVRWMWLAPGASERAATAAARELSTNLGGQVLPVLQSLAGSVNGIPAMAHELAQTAVREISGKAQAEIRHGVDLAVGPTGQVAGARADVVAIAGKLDARIGTEATAIRKQLGPVTTGAAGLLSTYEALPGQLREELRPVWRGEGKRPGLASELTCIREDGSGYGECIKARVTALMGEWTKAGGVLVKHSEPVAKAIEQAVESFAGMLEIGEEWADKNVRPRPMTLKEKFLAVVKVGISLFIAALRGGAL